MSNAAIEQDVDQSERKHKFEVGISYNGMDHRFDCAPHEHVKVLFDEAVRKYGVEHERDRLALYLHDSNDPLDNELTAEAAGIKPGIKPLLLRARTSGGG